jgi:hypothetical protein
MDDETRLDLSPLDPGADPVAWREFLARTQQRVDAVLTEREGPEGPMLVIASWRRRLLLAAAAALAMLVPAEIVLELRETRAERVQRLVAVSTHWGATPPTGAEFLRALSEQRR